MATVIASVLALLFELEFFPSLPEPFGICENW